VNSSSWGYYSDTFTSETGSFASLVSSVSSCFCVVGSSLALFYFLDGFDCIFSTGF
jgi:hypothetical protein